MDVQAPPSPLQCQFHAPEVDFDLQLEVEEAWLLPEPEPWPLEECIEEHHFLPSDFGCN